MSLSFGSGPLSSRPGGAFNFDLAAASPRHSLYFLDESRRFRAVVGDATVLDTTRAKWLYESNMAPVIYAPLDDYARGALVATATTTHCPFKGDASYWSLRVDDQQIDDVLWAYQDPNPEASFLRGFAALYFDKPDAWFIEDERVVAHPHDPFHRVDVHDSSREVVVTVNGTEVARTPRPKLLYETSLPLRAYVPSVDVVAGLVAPGSGKRTICPYKGEATYWTVNGVVDAAWSYETPMPDATKAAGHLSFDDTIDGVEVTIAQPHRGLFAGAPPAG